MFPYVEAPSISLGPLTLDGFELLVCTGVVVGYELVVRRAPRVGLEEIDAGRLTAWVILFGFVGSHVFDVVAYYPERLARNPLELFRIWGSMSSFGGLMGGVAAAVVILWRQRARGEEILRYVDCVAWAFPFAWIFGRAGCALAHDHLGVASDHWLAVRFPDGPRFDLGLLELLYTLPVAALFAWLGRRPRPNGLFVGLFFTLYGPVRFVLDTLRVDDARYLGWTPGQYLSLLATLAGMALLVWAVRRGTAPAAPAQAG